YGTAWASTHAPCRTSWAPTAWVTSITRTSGATLATTPWHTPTKGSSSPWSEVKVVQSYPAMPGIVAPRRLTSPGEGGATRERWGRRRRSRGAGRGGGPPRFCWGPRGGGG